MGEGRGERVDLSKPPRVRRKYPNSGIIIQMLSDEIKIQIEMLPPSYQQEVFDFVLFLRSRASDTGDLSKQDRQAIIDGLNTPLDACTQELDW